MRTTLSIDDDILGAARAIAESRGVPIGDVISELARRGLAPVAPSRSRNGVPLLPTRAGGGVVTPEIVRALLDEGA